VLVLVVLILLVVVLVVLILVVILVVVLLVLILRARFLRLLAGGRLGRGRGFGGGRRRGGGGRRGSIARRRLRACCSSNGGIWGDGFRCLVTGLAGFARHGVTLMRMPLGQAAGLQLDNRSLRSEEWDFT
jgi:hypothetical protein